MLARLLELTALILDFVEETYILDGDCGLVANVETSSICLSVKGRTSDRVSVKTPIGTPSRDIGTPMIVR